MRMSPTKGKDMWCPFARIVRGTLPGGNRELPPGNSQWTIDDANCCAGNDCMAWRGSDREGYCGLAGRPL